MPLFMHFKNSWRHWKSCAGDGKEEIAPKLRDSDLYRFCRKFT